MFYYSEINGGDDENHLIFDVNLMNISFHFEMKAFPLNFANVEG
jgi:hypothetical protein